MASPVLGIDLGTTNSVVAYADQNRVRVLRDEGGHLLTPSTVSFHPSGQILVGHPARERRLVDATNTVFSVKRLIGRPFRSPEVRRAAERLPFKLEEGATGGVMVQARGELYSLPEISSFVLRELRKVAEEALGQSCVNAVVTVPANFNELQRMATRDAGRIAGLNVLRILNEPTAAALAYGYQANTNQRIAVYDLGGGTFDISILELSGDVIEVVATAGDTYLGGDDIDRLIADKMVAEFLAKHFIDLAQDVQAYERVCLAAEWAKCQLSLLERAEVTVQEVAYSSNGKPIDLVFGLARSELDHMIFGLIGRTFDICEDALRLAGVRPSQLDGVILVGGQTRTPKVRDMVGEYFGVRPQSSVDPDLVVAQGAALQGFALSANRQDPVQSLTKTRSGTPLPPRMRSEPTLEYAKPRSLAQSSPPSSGFEDQPTSVAVRNPDAPFDDLPTTVAQRPDPAPARAAAMPKSTLTGVGSKAPPVPAPLAAGAALPTPPPIAAVLESARAPAPTRTLAETPGAKLGKRPSGLPRSIPQPSAAPVTLPPAPRVPADAAAFPLAMNEIAEEAVPAALKAQRREAASPAPAPRVTKPATSTLAETPKAKAAQRAASLAPPAAPAASVAPAAAPVSQVPVSAQEPIRTHSMARLFATQGHVDRALAIYDELIAKNPGDVTLAKEAAALRAGQVSAPAPVAPAPAPVWKAPQPSAAATPVSMPASTPAVKDAVPAAPPAAVATTQSQFPAPARPNAPLLLLDVTPHTLSVETAGGFCEQVIERNAPIPTEQTRIFSTSQDNQVVVSMRVCQGEARRTDENQVLGQIELMGLRTGRRGEISIAVTFIIDADGTLLVKAQDRTTGQAQAIRVSLVGAIEPGDIERMRSRQGNSIRAGKR